MAKDRSLNRSNPSINKCRFSVFRTTITSDVKRHRVKSEDVHFQCESSILEPFECRLCDFETDLKLTADRHVTLVHENVNNYYADSEVEMTVYRCDQCSFKTYSILVFARHVCAKSYSTVEEVHSSSNLFECLFKSESNAERITWYECDQTNQHHVFKHKNLEKVVQYKCEHCPYTSNQKGNLKTHFLEKHEKPEYINWHECEQCSFRTKRKSYLKKHNVFTHGSPEWFECEQCSFKTKTKSNLKRHFTCMHELTKWFECEQCPFKTKRKYCLKKHVEIKHKSLEWLECEQCSYSTKRTHKLREHIVSKHKSAEWFECEQCFFLTKKKRYLQRHIKNIHEAITEENVSELTKNEQSLVI